MTSHKDYRLDQLGIASQYEADELERDLNVRFDLFAYNDREVWVQQNAYLDAYAYNRTVTESADTAGVPVSIAQNWKHFNTLGFKRRLEIADLRFSDSLQVLALERVREPDAPATLLIALLRAHIPEKFSTNGHVCDTSKADEQHFFYGQDAKRELEAGHPGLSAIADGTYQPPHRSRSHDDPSYTGTPSADAASNPAHDPSAPSAVNPPHPSVRPEPVEGQFPSPTRHSREHGNPQTAHPYSIEWDHDPSSSHETPFPLPDDDIEPIDPDEVAFFNLSPEERKATPNPSAPSAVNPPHPSVRPEPVEGQFPSPTRHSREHGNPQTAHPYSIEWDHDPSSSHETPFPLPDDDIEPIDPDEVAFFNLSPEERKATPNPSAPSVVNPPAHPSVRPEPVEGQFPSPTHHSREHGNPQTAHPHSIESDHETPFPLPDDDIEPVDPDEVAFFNLPSSERKDTSHPNSSPTDTPPADAASNPAHDPSAVNPPAPKRPARLIASLFQKARPNPNDNHDTFPVKRF